MRFGIPQVPPAARRARRRGRAHPRHGREARAGRQGRPTSAQSMRDGGFDAAFLAVGAHRRPSAPTSRPAAGAHPRCRVGAALDGRRGEAACSAGGWSSMAAATPRSTWRAPPGASAPTEAIIVYRRTRERCRRTSSRSRRRCEEGVMMQLAIDHQAAWTSGTLTVEKMALDAKRLPAADRRARDARGATRSCSRSGRTSTCRCSTACPALEVKDGVVAGRPEHDDRPCRASSPAATWCRPSAR